MNSLNMFNKKKVMTSKKKVPILIDERDNERDYEIFDGRIITIVYDEDDVKFLFKEGGELIGKYSEFEFVFRDHSPDKIEERFLLARMYSPIIQSGLGRVVLEWFIEITSGARIYTREDDGIVREDGSHLTDDAPNFVRKMQGEGLIEPWFEYDREDY